MIEWLEHIDQQLFLFLNGLHSPFFDPIMYYASKFYISLPLYAYIIITLYRTKSIKQATIIFTLMILCVALADIISVAWFKEVFLRYRPSHNLELQPYIHFVKHYKGGTYGFVSSHTANTFAFATFAAFILKNKTITTILFVWAGIVTYSRIYLGVHYPADVTCGALVGALISIVIYIIYSKLKFKLESKE
jgi:undecaprenyl-diphosphatase